MKIQWFGNSTFLLTTNLGKKILLDPFNIFSTLNENITAFNQGSNSIQISYAVGKAHSSCYVGNVTMKVLFERADYDMYQNKMAEKNRGRR
mgnify:CR=1 FL=1